MTSFEWSKFLEAAGAVLKIGLSLKSSTIGKFSFPKSVKRSVYITLQIQEFRHNIATVAWLE